MSSFERLDALREQNKDLLMRLRHQTEKLQSLTCGVPPAKEAGADSEDRSARSMGIIINGSNAVFRMPLTEINGDPTDSVVTFVGGCPGVARAALRRPRTMETSEETVDSVTDRVCKTSTPSQRTAPPAHQSQPAEDPVYCDLLQDRGNNRPPGPDKTLEFRRPKPILLTQESDRREVGRVTFQSPGQEQVITSERHHVQPLLGYDWIAGLLDAESSLTERSEQFFSELRSFRQVNRDECVHSLASGPAVVADLPFSPLAVDEMEPQHTADTHQCTFCYRINSRLFPTPLDPQATCPVCRMPKSKHPQTVSEPAFIRVSIPRSTLLPAYRYKAHRRCSFDPSDSLGLPSHCLSGWSNTVPNSASQMSSLDLRSSMATEADASMGVPSTQPREQADLSVSRVSGSQRSDHLLNVSRLARYRFQHQGPKRSKPHGSSYPVY